MKTFTNKTKRTNKATCNLIAILFLVGMITNINTSNAQKLYVPNGTVGTSSTSNVGIGTSGPTYPLEVVTSLSSGWTTRILNNYGGTTKSSVYMCHGYGYGMYIRGYTTGGQYTLYLANENGLTNRFLNNGQVHLGMAGNVGIGTLSPSTKLDVAGSAQVDYLFVNPQNSTDEGGEIRMDGAGTYTTWYYDNYRGRIRWHNNGSEKLTLLSNGNVGIGISNPYHKLEVAGNVKVHGDLCVVPNVGDACPDYVFEPEYKLKPLPELEAYLNENKHLPNVPSTREIEETGGINVVKMNYALLEKVEEITLYTIEQDKQIKEQEKRIKQLKDEQQKQIDQLRNELLQAINALK